MCIRDRLVQLHARVAMLVHPAALPVDDPHLAVGRQDEVLAEQVVWQAVKAGSSRSMAASMRRPCSSIQSISSGRGAFTSCAMRRYWRTMSKRRISLAKTAFSWSVSYTHLRAHETR